MPYMYKPDFGEEKPTMFICGNDERSEKTVTGILDSFWLETEDMGRRKPPLPMNHSAVLWCIPGIIGVNGLPFRVVETPEPDTGKGVKQSIFYTSQPLISPLIISNRIFTILEGIFETYE